MNLLQEEYINNPTRVLRWLINYVQSRCRMDLDLEDNLYIIDQYAPDTTEEDLSADIKFSHDNGQWYLEPTA